MKIHHYISAVMAFMCLMIASLTACSDTDHLGNVGAGVGGDGGERFRIGFDVMLPYLPGSRATYEEGVGDYENTINLKEDDYRILLFTHDTNTLVCSFEPDSVELVENTPSLVNPTYRSYRLYANVDKEIAGYTNLRLVMLANWRKYPVLRLGETTIDDLAGYALSTGAVSTSDATTFEASAQLIATPGKYIPMFGVKECKDIDWVNSGLSWLGNLGDLWMLRAVAKIEVETAEYSPKIESVILTRYNKRGTCAPKQVYSQSDYVTNSEYYKSFDYLTLPGSKNDADGNYIIQQNEDGKFVVYVPEYQIVADPSKPKEHTSDYSSLLIKFEGNTNEYQVDFKYYTQTVADSNGANKDDFFDLKRNYCYRYTVGLRNLEPEVKVDVLPYRAVTLKPEFGLPLKGLSLSKNLVYLYTNVAGENVVTKSSDTIRALDENGKQLSASEVTWTFQNVVDEDTTKLDQQVKDRDKEIENHHPGAIKGNNCYLYEDENGNCVVMSRALARGRDVIVATTTDSNGMSIEAELVVEVSGRHLGFDKTFIGLMPGDKDHPGSSGSFNGTIIAETDADTKLRWRLLTTDASDIDAADSFKSDLEYLRENIVVRVDGVPLSIGSNEWAIIGERSTFTVELQGGVFTGEANLWVEVECPARNEVEGRARYSTYCNILVEEPSISCFPQKAFVSVGQSISVAAIISPKFSDYFPEVKYVCSDPSVATVDSNGLIHANKKGNVTIEIYNDTDFDNKISCTMEVTVTNNPLVLVRADDMSEILRQVELKAGEQIQLKAYSNGVDVTESKLVEWSVVDRPSSLNIVEVNKGLVKAPSTIGIDRGTVTVQARYEVDGVMQTQRCVVVVAKERKLIINQQPYAVEVGSEVPLSAYFFPDKRPMSKRNDEITWLIEGDQSIADIKYENGQYYAVANKEGVATIKAEATYSYDGKSETKSDTLAFEVVNSSKPNPPTKVNNFKVCAYDANGNLATVTYPYNNNSTGTEIKSEYKYVPIDNTTDPRNDFDFISIKQGETWTIRIVGEPDDISSLNTTREIIYRFESYHHRRISATVSGDGKSVSVTALRNTGESDTQVNNRYNELVIRFSYDGKEYTRHIVIYTPYHY